MTRPSLYEFAGGDEALIALAAATTERCIADSELNHPFGHGLSPRHNENLAAYRAEVFGGPAPYSSSLGGHSGMLEIHTGHGAPDEWGDRFAACFLPALDDAELPDDTEFRAAMRHYIHWATREVNTYAPAGAQVPGGRRMPHWDWGGLVEEH